MLERCVAITLQGQIQACVRMSLCLFIIRLSLSYQVRKTETCIQILQNGVWPVCWIRLRDCIDQLRFCEIVFLYLSQAEIPEQEHILRMFVSPAFNSNVVIGIACRRFRVAASKMEVSRRAIQRRLLSIDVATLFKRSEGFLFIPGSQIRNAEI